MWHRWIRAGIILPIGSFALASRAREGAETSSESPKAPTAFDDLLAQLQKARFVDLTHAFAPGIPHWSGIPDEEREALYHHDPGVGTRGSGFFIQRFSVPGQWGTHVDAPVHFVKGLRTLDQIDVREMVLPMVVLDVHKAVESNPDYTVTMDDVRDWERRHGSIKAGSFVALRTDWSKRWPDATAIKNLDSNGVSHIPGWSREVLRFLYEVRDIMACGHDTPDTDPGTATSRGDFSLEHYVLSQDKYQIELLANLDQVPEHGAIVVVAFPKPQGGSGFPARVFAISP
jgi:kynurenine formamidase